MFKTSISKPKLDIDSNIHYHHHQVYGLGFVTCSSSELLMKYETQFDNW